MDKELYDLIQERFNFYFKIALDVLSELAEMSEDELYLCHFGIGLYIRNYILLPDSDIYKKFILNGILHKDDMSTTIIKAWHKMLRSMICK